MKAAGLDGIELEAYGHLMDQFWSPLTNALDAPVRRLARQPAALHVRSPRRHSPARLASEFIVGVRYTADEALEGGLTRKRTVSKSRVA